MVCSKCSAESPEGNRFCPQCGSSLVQGSQDAGAGPAGLQPGLALSAASSRPGAAAANAASMQPNVAAANAASMQPNVAASLCYALGPVTGLAFTILEKESRLVRFHAMQSMVVFGAATVGLVVFCVLPVVGPLLGLTFGMLWLTLAIVMMVKAYHWESFKLPFAGDFAEKNS